MSAVWLSDCVECLGEYIEGSTEAVELDHGWRHAECPTLAAVPDVAPSQKDPQRPERVPVYAIPRLRLKATYDVKELWSRLVFDEFGPGGWITQHAPDFSREHLLWSQYMLRVVNGRTGDIRMGDKSIAQALGYHPKGHPGTEARRMLIELGLFTPTGTNAGRVKVLWLTAPVCLMERDEYSLLADSVLDTSLETGLSRK